MKLNFNNHNHVVVCLQKALNLSSVESDIYFYLLRTGGVNASKLSLYFDRNRVEIYRTLKRLEKMGLLIKTTSNPSFYYPIIPKHIINDKINMYSTIINDLKLLKKITISEVNNESSKINLWKLESKSFFLKYVNKIIINASKEIIIKISENRLNFLYNTILNNVNINKNFLYITVHSTNRFIYPDLNIYNIKVVNKDIDLLFIRVDNKKCILKLYDNKYINSFFYGECNNSCDILNFIIDIMEEKYDKRN
jgi:sugar-specific transcriptional regulator TrmB